jgi:hypothetical protein
VKGVDLAKAVEKQTLECVAIDPDGDPWTITGVTRVGDQLRLMLSPPRRTVEAIVDDLLALRQDQLLGARARELWAELRTVRGAT